MGSTTSQLKLDPLSIHPTFILIVGGFKCHIFLSMTLKKMYYDFPKMRGGGLVKGRLELFRKCIRFGGATCP